MLPYTTAAEVVRICKELLANSEPTSLDNPPVLDYTYDELKQYKGASVEEIPEEIKQNISSNIDVFVPHLSNSYTYVELATKDGHIFKGVLYFSYEGTCTCYLNCINYISSSASTEWLSLKFDANIDTETGESQVVFHGIEYNIVR